MALHCDGETWSACTVCAANYTVTTYEDVPDVTDLLRTVQPTDVLMAAEHTVPNIPSNVQCYKVPHATSAFDMANRFVQHSLQLPPLQTPESVSRLLVAS